MAYTEKWCVAPCTILRGTASAAGALHNVPLGRHCLGKSPALNDSLSMDSITKLPCPRSSHTSIFVVVDRLTRMVHFIPTVDKLIAPEGAALSRDRILSLHGMPKDIVSNRDVQFTSNLWRELHALLGTRLMTSSACHPQSDGQAEGMNRVLENMLRHSLIPS